MSLGEIVFFLLLGGLLTVLFVLTIKIAAHYGILGDTLHHILANNNEYSELLDIKINRILDLLEAGEITAEQDTHKLILSTGDHIWTSNFPYACYTTYNGEGRVSWKTFRRMRKWHLEFLRSSIK